MNNSSLTEYFRVNREKCEETEGFDVQAGLTWIYPTNYPKRDYQFNIIEQALFQNTLVNLPTGLGKTFIAAVVMFNYYRWYPTGKIVFMAPTRPLVKQQVDACYDIMAIPRDVTAELTGTNKISIRNDVWFEKRVFFVTPQVLQNDLDNCPELAAAIKCIVFDEAHKARGNYAYCGVMKRMKAHAKYFRVLALSATPGNNINDVGEVISTLMISHLEYRTEESEDVKPYVFQRKLETMVVPLGAKLEQVKNDYSEVLERYNRTLVKHKVVQGNCSTLTKGAIFRIKKEYQEKNNRDSNYQEINLTLNICMSLYHANELLIRHGLRGFLSYFEEHINDPLLRNNVGLLNIMEDIRSYLGPLPDIDMLPDGSYPEVPLNITFGHPKFYRLRDVLITHFNNSEENSKVIVFFEYRDSVKEAFLILLQARPLIRPEMFVGQKSGVVTQKMQLKVIKTFRDGNCNTLLSTSIGEEGLDVGEVDLIICFDISNKSPIRMVQRMGRTGRKREGKVVILVTEGREQQTLSDCLYYKNNMKNWAGSKELMKKFFVQSPRMVPKELNPKCMKMQITVTKPPETKTNSIKNFLKRSSSGSTSFGSDDVEIISIEERIPGQLALFNKSYSEIKSLAFEPFCSNYIEHQRIFQNSDKFESSDASKLFVDLMKYADAKRFNIPLTQNSQLSKNFKQRDIRNMFSNIGPQSNILSSQDDFVTCSLPLPSQNELNEEDTKRRQFLNELNEEIAIYLSIRDSTPKICVFCEKGFKCSKYRMKKDSKILEELDNWVPPESDFFESITAEDFESYLKPETEEKDPVEDTFSEFIDEDLLDMFADQKDDPKIPKDKSINFDLPKSFGNILNQYNITSTLPSQKENFGEVNMETAEATICKSSNNEEVSDVPQNICENESLKSVLSFFKLDKIEDIFEEGNNPNNSDDSDKTIINEDMIEELNERGSSPVLSTQVSQRKLIITKNKNVEIPGSPVLDSSILSRSQNVDEKSCLDIIDTSIEEVFTVPKIFSQKSNKNLRTRENGEIEEKEVKTRSNESDGISDEENLLGIFSTKKKTGITQEYRLQQLSLNDVFDLKAFGLTLEDIKNGVTYLDKVSEEKENIEHSLNQDDNDLYNFSQLVNAESTRIEKFNGNRSEKNRSVINSTNDLLENNENNSSIPEVDDFCDLSIFGLTEDEAHNSKLKEIKQHNKSCNVFTQNTSQFEPSTKSIDLKSLVTQNNRYQNSPENSRVHEKTNCLKTLKSAVILERDKIAPSTERTQNNVNIKNDLNNSDIVIIEDSPVKNDCIDLTQSPSVKGKLPTKRKLLSQMTISQILSLAEKPSQTSLTLNNKLSPSEKHVVSSDRKQKSSFSKSLLNEEEKKDEDDFELLSVPKPSTQKGDINLLDDLGNFEEFAESLSSKEPSPIFKMPSTSKTNFKVNSRKRKRSESNDEVHKTQKRHSKRLLDSSILNSNSDDEFEDSILSNSFSMKKTSPQTEQNNSSPEIPRKKVRKKKKISDLIQDEAEVSFDNCSITDDENESEEDGSFDESFVDDETENIENDTQIHAKYLQSVKSPTTGPKFKMPKFVKPITDDIFSQVADRDELGSYVEDSFCVDTEDIIEESHELSELDILEQKLKEMKKKRKQEKAKENKVIKRKWIRIIDSDSE